MAGLFDAVIQGRQLGQQNRLAHLTSQAYSAAPEQRTNLLGQMASISPQAAQAQQTQFDQQEDRTAQQLRGYVGYVNNARKSGNPQALNAALRAGSGLIERLTGKPGPTEWTPDMDAGWAELEARVAMAPPDGQTPAGLREFNALTQGLSQEDQLAARRVKLGLDGRASSSGFTQVKFTGADGRERVGVLNGRTGRIDLPDGTSFDPQTGQSAPTEGAAPTFSPGQGQQAIDQIAASANQMIAAGMPEAQVEAWAASQLGGGQVQEGLPASGNQFQTSTPVVSGPSPFVGRSPEEQAARTEAAKLQTQLQYMPQQQALETQGAIARAQGLAGVTATQEAAALDATRSRDAASTLELLDEAERLLPGATGSTLGAIRDRAAGAVGVSTTGAQRAAALRTIGGQLTSKMPRMQGPQSDKDVQLYREMAGDLANDQLPVETRMVALETIRDLNRKYAGGPRGGGAQRTITRRGTMNGRRVVQYSDGSVEYGD